MDKENLFIVYSKLRKEVNKKTDSISFETLYEPTTFLSKFSIIEIITSFYLFKSTYLILENSEKKDCLDSLDYIYCSVFERVFNISNLFNFINISIKLNTSYNVEQLR